MMVSEPTIRGAGAVRHFRGTTQLLELGAARDFERFS